MQKPHSASTCLLRHCGDVTISALINDRLLRSGSHGGEWSGDGGGQVCGAGSSLISHMSVAMCWSSANLSAPHCPVVIIQRTFSPIRINSFLAGAIPLSVDLKSGPLSRTAVQRCHFRAQVNREFDLLVGQPLNAALVVDRARQLWHLQSVYSWRHTSVI